MHLDEKSESEQKIRLFDNATIYIKVACGVILLSLIFHIVAFSTSYWTAAYVKDVMWWHEGLWSACSQNIMTNRWVCGSYNTVHHSGTLPDWLHATQGLTSLALIALVPANFLTLLFAMLPKLSGRKFCAILAMVTCFAAAVLMFISVVVYAAKYPKNNTSQQSVFITYNQEQHFSFAFEILAFIGALASGILLLLDYRFSVIL